MDIRRFFAPTEKKPGSEALEKNQMKNVDKGLSNMKKADVKRKDSCKSKAVKQKPVHRNKRIIYDSDSESEASPPEKKNKKESSSSKPTKFSTAELVISETDEEDDILQSKKVAQKSRENGGHPGTSGSGRTADTTSQLKPTKPKSASPVKFTATSVQDFFGSGSVHRSSKKLVTSKRKAPSPSFDSTADDEELARQLQLDEDTELERQLHEDEEFARTLAMLDDLPKSKKARTDRESQEFSLSLVVKAEPRKTADEQTAEHSAKMLNEADNVKNCSEKFSKSQSTRISSKLSTESSSTNMEKSLKASPGKLSAKVANMKRKEESVKVIRDSPTKPLRSKRISPRKEEKTLSSKKGETTISPKKEQTSSSKKGEQKVFRKEEEQTVSPNTKEKVSPSKPESKSPEDTEKKRQNYLAYRSFLNRDGPRALGSKEIPQGAENCLEGLSFVITGVLESMERDDAKSLIERYGGKLTGNISKKTNYLVTGRDGGRSKLDKAESFGTKQIDEDGLLNLIRRMPGKRSKYDIAAEEEVRKTTSKSAKISDKNEHTKNISPPSIKQKEHKKSSPAVENGESSGCLRSISFGAKTSANNSTSKCDRQPQKLVKEYSLLWVDKYRPAALKNIIGQQGEQSCANKLVRWLKKWHSNYTGGSKPAVKFSKFGGKDNGSSFKAALLSGPPGIGKTTTATLACKELGYNYVELNASDTRSKNTLKEVIAESLNNTSIKGYCSGTSLLSTKHALIMDEVDGMAGNEDRGGIQELISLIKQTKIPIICMCNDRNHSKIRSLANYCFDLRFQRPRLEQIKGAMMTVAFKEGLKIPPPAMNEIILAASQDIRQVLHNLSMWCAKNETLTYDQAKENGRKTKKDIKLGPFDVVRKVFSAGEESASMSLIDKSDLFFHDYSLSPLFVQENYLHVKPAASGSNLKKHLMLLSKTADSICDGDHVDKRIRSQQAWNLLPTQAIYASVIPGELMRGYMAQFPTFPSWLGKFSSTGKHDRTVQELTRHMCLRTHASKRAVNLDYLPYLRDTLVRPLALQGTNGVQEAVETMDAYYLMKEDVDSIMEISSWGGRPDPFSKLDPKVKAAFTRTYNKETHMTPYALQAIKKLKHGNGAGSSVDSELNGDLQTEDVQADEAEDNLEMDGMIKPKKSKASKSKTEEKLPQHKGRKDKGKKKATK